MAGQKQLDFAKQVVRRLRIAGYQALFAGGCVRDMLRKVQPKDYDIATSARPPEVKELFRRTLMVGAKFGVVVVLGPKTQVEVATFRSDVAYKDGRRPERVVFGQAEQDAQRRDFTINGMFYDPFENKVIDYVGGQADLSRRIIRAIGDPQRRFAEDHLRMFRAVRFACTLNFGLEDSTARAISSQAEKIKRISAERITDELLLILQSQGCSQGVDLAGWLGLLKVIMPEVDYVSAAQRLGRLGGSSAPAALACLFYGLDQTYHAKQAGNKARSLCQRLKLSNKLTDQTAWLAETAMALVVARATGQEPSLAQLKRMMASGVFRELLWVYGTVAPEQDCRRICSQSRQIDPKKVSPQPLLNGQDLLAMGLKSGPSMGKCLAAVYEAQLEEQIQTKTQARKLAKDWLKQHCPPLARDQ